METHGQLNPVTEIKLEDITLIEQKKQTPYGEAVHMKVKQTPRKVFMSIQSRTALIASWVSSSIDLYNGDVSIKNERKNIDKSFVNELPVPTSYSDLTPGTYWQEDENSEIESAESKNELKDRLGFQLGTITIEPREHGVLASRSGINIRGLNGVEVRIFHEGKIIAGTTEASAVQPEKGIVEIGIKTKNKNSKLIVVLP